MKKIFTYLFATAALMIISAAAMAQGGASPFEGSTHIYRVTPGASGNTYQWSITGGAGTSGYTINTATTGTTGTGEIIFSVTWNTASATDYTISFTETTPAPASCSTVKEFDVTVITNTFDVSISSPTETCNAADGQINYSGPTATTTVVFKVDMATGNAAFSPDWGFLFSLAPSAEATIESVSASSGDLAAGSVSGSYSLINLTSSNGTGTVDITIDVTGDIHTLLDVDFEITSATELDYNTPDMDTDDWMATQTINAIPNTSNITTD